MHIRLPHYFSHKMRTEMVELYASTIIANFALAMVVLFEPIYFVTVLKWNIAQVLWFYIAVYGLYLLLIPLGAKLVASKGPAHTILYSIPFQVGYWFCLFMASQHITFVILAAVCFALQKSLYWPAFHVDVVKFADSDQRSREFSGISAFVHIVFIAGPFIGGWISQNFGMNVLLVTASIFYFTMFIPLFTRPEKVEKKVYRYRSSWSYFRKFPREAASFFGYGEELIFAVIWPIFIFTILPNFFDLGAVVAVTTLIATILVLIVGRAVDVGRRKSVLLAGASFAMIAWVVQAAASVLTHLVLGDSASRTSRDSLYVLIISMMYERANRQDPLTYVVFFEQALSFGKLTAALIGIGLYTLTGELYPILILGALYTIFYFLLPLSQPKLLGSNSIEGTR